MRSTSSRQFLHDHGSDGGMLFTGLPLLQKSASFFAASAASRLCFKRGPSLVSSVLPVRRNSIQFSIRSLAKMNTTRSNCSCAHRCCRCGWAEGRRPGGPRISRSGEAVHPTELHGVPRREEGQRGFSHRSAEKESLLLFLPQRRSSSSSWWLSLTRRMSTGSQHL